MSVISSKSKVHLKEFSFISPVIESAEVFKAIETTLPSAGTRTGNWQHGQIGTASAQTAISTSSLFSHRHESVVARLDANSAKEAGEWVEYAVDSAGAVLASARQLINQRSQKRELGVR